MWVVIDWCTTKVIGPFNGRDAAEDWLESKYIHKDELEESEVSINAICDPITYNFGNMD